MIIEIKITYSPLIDNHPPAFNMKYAFYGYIKFPSSMVSARFLIPLPQIVDHWLCNQRNHITNHMGHQMTHRFGH
jgi:hypothetical protein